MFPFACLLITSMLDLLTVEQKFTLPALRREAVAIDRYLLPAPDFSSKPAGPAASVDRRKKQTGGEADGQTLDRFKTFTADCADGVIRGTFVGCHYAGLYAKADSRMRCYAMINLVTSTPCFSPACRECVSAYSGDARRD